MAIEETHKCERELATIKKNINNYEIQSSEDANLIKNIENQIFNNKNIELIRDYSNIIKNNIETVHEHQKFTSVAIYPFIKINNEVKVANHYLLEIDPFIFLNKDEDQKKNFDALILNMEENYNTILFLETKSSKNFQKAIKNIVSKIKLYESFQMQNYIKKYFKIEHNLSDIDRIEYVLITQPYEYIYESRKLKKRKIKIEKRDGSEEEIYLPLIIWTVNRAVKDSEANFYYLLYHPINENVIEARKLRQHHHNDNLIKFLSKKRKVDLSTQLFSLKFSPALDINYQFIMATIELLKLNKSRLFNKQQLIDLISAQLFLNLKKDEIIDYLVEKIINKGISTRIYKENEEDNFEIKLRKTKQSKLIQEELINKISNFEAREKIKTPQIQLDLYKKIVANFLMNKHRTGRTMRDFI